MNFKHLVALCGAFFIAFAPLPSTADIVPLSRTGKLEVLFSPQDDIGAAVVRHIDSARERVWLAGYYFTHADIASALARAKSAMLTSR